MKNHNRLFLLQPDESSETARVVAMIEKVIAIKDEVLSVADDKATQLVDILEDARKSRLSSHAAQFTDSTKATKDEAEAREAEKTKIGDDFTKFIADTTGTPDNLPDANTLFGLSAKMNENYDNHEDATNEDAKENIEALKGFIELLGDVDGTPFPQFELEV